MNSRGISLQQIALFTCSDSKSSLCRHRRSPEADGAEFPGSEPFDDRGQYQYEIRRIIVYRARESSLGTPTENVAGQTSVNGPHQLSSGVIDPIEIALLLFHLRGAVAKVSVAHGDVWIDRF